MINRKQAQALALQYIAEKANDGLAECAFCDDSGIDMPECFRGWFLELDDFKEWLPKKFHADSAEIFDCMQGLIGLQ